jgi:hypothetical protein
MKSHIIGWIGIIILIINFILVQVVFTGDTLVYQLLNLVAQILLIIYCYKRKDYPLFVLFIFFIITNIYWIIQIIK